MQDLLFLYMVKTIVLVRVVPFNAFETQVLYNLLTTFLNPIVCYQEI